MLAGIVTVRIWASGAGDKLEVVFDKTANGEGIQKVLATKDSVRWSSAREPAAFAASIGGGSRWVA